MEKLKLQQLIKRYNLRTSIKNSIEDVLWTVEDNNLLTVFQDASRKVYGKIVVPNFELTDGEYPMRDANKLLKSISVLSDTITLKDSPAIVYMADKEYTIEVHKADKSVIESDSWIFDEALPNSPFKYKGMLDKDFIEKFLKVYKATSTEEDSTFSIFCNESIIQFRIGNVRRIKFETESVDDDKSEYTGIYPVVLFANMIESNKECSELKIEIHELFIYLDFYYDDGTNTQYIFVQQEEEID